MINLIGHIVRIGFGICRTQSNASPRSLPDAGNYQTSGKENPATGRHNEVALFDSLLLSLLLLCMVISPVSAQIIQTVAGGGIGDGSAATAAPIHAASVAIDSSGNLYVSGGTRIRKVTVATGVIITVAGTGATGYNGDNIAATSATLSATGIAIDTSDNLYIADSGNNRIRKVSARTGLITTVAGTGTRGYDGDNIAATNAMLALFNFPTNTIGGDGSGGIAVDASGNLFIEDVGNQRVRKVAAVTGIITTVAGGNGVRYNGDGIAGTEAGLATPTAVVVDASGNLFIVDQNDQRVRKVAVGTGIITTVAGTGTLGFNGDNIPAASARLQFPSGITVDTAGNLYVVDAHNNRIRKVAVASGIITSVAGNGSGGYNGDNIAATSATLSATGIAIDATGNLYIADSVNNRVRKVTAATGVITTIAGNGTTRYDGDNITAVSAALNSPAGVAVDSFGNFYFTGNDRIRKVTVVTGVITTVAGSGVASGDNVAATAAQLSSPNGVAFDSSGNLYIADTGDRKSTRLNSSHQ